MRRLKTWEKVTLGAVGVSAIGGLIWWATRPRLPVSNVAKGIAEGGVSGGLQQPPQS